MFYLQTRYQPKKQVIIILGENDFFISFGCTVANSVCDMYTEMMIRDLGALG